MEEYENDYYDYTYQNEDIYNDKDTDKDTVLSLKKTVSGMGSLDEAKCLMEKIIDEVRELTCLSRDNAIIVLIQNNWNKDKIEATWFEDIEKNKIKIGMEYDKSLKLDQTKNYCMVCLDSPKKGEKFVGLSCNHLFCPTCFKEYLEFKVEDKITCVFTTCMMKDCNVLVPSSLFEKFLSESKYKLYYENLLKNYTEHNDDIKWCPNPGCGRFVKSKNHAPRDVTCECGTVFCFKCLREGHRPCSCLLMDIWDKKNNSDGENVLWLKANTKQCPKCGKHIEKNQGCNHMKCSKQAGGCDYDFCWICMGEWKPHGTDWYNCTKYDPKSTVNIEKEKDTQKIKGELEKFAHYFERSFNHNKSMKINMKLRATIENKKNIFFKVRKMNIQELEFLNEALEVVIRCHRVLSHTYIFGYYMNEKAVNQKSLYEYQLKLLSDNVDKLNEMLENNEIQDILDIEHVDKYIQEFNKYRTKVMSLATVTEKFMNNLVDFIENDLIEFIDYKAISK